MRLLGLDRQGLLRDISEMFAKDKMNVTSFNLQSTKDGTAWMSVTVEVGSAARLQQELCQLTAVPGVRRARRR